MYFVLNKWSSPDLIDYIACFKDICEKKCIYRQCRQYHFSKTCTLLWRQDKWQRCTI